MNKDMQQLSEKIDYLTKLVETIIEDKKLCNNSKTRKMKTDAILKMLEDTPLAKNPLFKQVFDPMKEVLTRV